VWLRSTEGPADLRPVLAITLAAGGGSVTFTATVVGTTAPVTWTLGGVGSISTSSGASCTYTPPAAAEATVQATLTARAGDGQATASITVTPSPYPPVLVVDPPALQATAGDPPTT
jgi:hypothetical protein